MKKNYLLIILTLLAGIITLPVHAANYEVKELIPVDVTTSVKGQIYLYKGISCKDGIIQIQSIRNNSYEAKPLSVSIALFGEDKKNIGIIHYCEKETKIATKETKKDFLLDIKGSYLASGKTYKDIKYYSVIGENTTCRNDGSQEFIGSTVEQIGMPKNTGITDSTELLLNMLKVIAVVLVGLFLYKFIFTSAYQNMDGEDIRQGYAYVNKELRKEREREARRNPPQPKVVKSEKTDEVRKQEQKENSSENKNNSDLHNMYK